MAGLTQDKQKTLVLLWFLKQNKFKMLEKLKQVYQNLLESVFIEYDDENNNSNNDNNNNDSEPLLIGHKTTSTTALVCCKRRLNGNTIDRHWKQ